MSWIGEWLKERKLRALMKGKQPVQFRMVSENHMAVREVRVYPAGQNCFEIEPTDRVIFSRKLSRELERRLYRHNIAMSELHPWSGDDHELTPEEIDAPITGLLRDYFERKILAALPSNSRPFRYKQ